MLLASVGDPGFCCGHQPVPVLTKATGACFSMPRCGCGAGGCEAARMRSWSLGADRCCHVFLPWRVWWRSLNAERCCHLLPCMQEYVRERRLEVPIEVETRTLEELGQLLALMRGDAGMRVDRVMLDNMTRLDASKPGEASKGVRISGGDRPGTAGQATSQRSEGLASGSCRGTTRLVASRAGEAPAGWC